jgi:hypothetical protein
VRGIREDGRGRRMDSGRTVRFAGSSRVLAVAFLIS